jgi:phage-related minor tail protein
MSSELGEAKVPIRATLDKLDADLKQARGKIDGALKGLDDNLQKIGKIALGGIVAGLALIGTALAGIGLAGINAARDFEDATAAIIIGTGAAGEELAEMEGIAKNLMRTTAGLGSSFGDIGQVIADVNTRTGATGETLEELSSQILNVSRLTGTDAAENVRLLTRVMGDWDLELEQSAGLMDTLFAASQVTGMGVDDLSRLVVQFGAPLRQMEFSLEESVALLGKWEKEGVNTELVLGSLRIAMGNFARDNIPMREGLENTISRIQELGPGAEATSLAMQVFGARAGPDMAASILEGRFEIEELVQALEGSEGALDDASKRSMKFSDRMELMKNRVTTALMPIGEAFLDIADKVMPHVEKAFEFFETNIVPILQQVAEFVGIFLGDVLEGVPILEALGGALEQVFGPETAATVMGVVDSIMEFKDRVFELLAPIIEAVTNFVSWKDVLIGLGITIAAVVLPALWGVIAAAAPIIATAVAIIAVVALLRNAWENDWGGIRTFIVNLWDNKLKPLFDTLREWLAVNIPVAIDTLKSFWENTLLPAIQNVWSWIQNTLFPLFQRLWDWLGVTIPAVLETLGNFWTNTLLPAIEAVWDFISNSLIPLFVAIWELLEVAGGIAITALQGLWENVLLPALTTVWEFIKDKLQPVFETLHDFWENTLGPALLTVKENVLDKLTGVFGDIRDAIKWVIDRISEFTEVLKKVKLPDWLTPGSPTPFEMGLRGISDELQKIGRMRMPAFESAFADLAAGSDLIPSALHAQDSRQFVRNLTINTNAQIEPELLDWQSGRSWSRS